MPHPGEEQEWVETRVESWVENYKKRQITERSLCRALKRLQDSGHRQPG